MFKIFTLAVSDFEQNCRILACMEDKLAVVVDPGGDVSKIQSFLQEHNLACEQIWLTHSHLDHCGAVAPLKEATNAKLFAHSDGKFLRERVQEVAVAYGLDTSAMQNCPEPDEYIKEGDILSFGKYKFKVLFTPGHSPGHVCFYNAEQAILLTGDTLFAGSIGRTDLPGGDYETLMRSIQNVILTLSDETKILSGHGPDSSVGVEKTTNPFLLGGSNG